MAGTVYDQALRRITGELLKDKAWADVLVEILQKLNNRFWAESYVDFFFQKGGWMNTLYTLEDAYAFGMMHSMLGSGKIAACDLKIRDTPSANALSDQNLEKMRRGLTNLVSTQPGVADPTFDVDLWCGLNDEDGVLRWTPYLEFQVFADGKPHHSTWLPQPRRVPIEVGSQAPGKTLVQLNTIGALARWPYGSDTMRIFCVLQPSQRLRFPYKGIDPRVMP